MNFDARNAIAGEIAREYVRNLREYYPGATDSELGFAEVGARRGALEVLFMLNTGKLKLSLDAALADSML